MENSLLGIVGGYASPATTYEKPIVVRVYRRFSEMVGGMPQELLWQMARAAVAEYEAVSEEAGASLPGHIRMPTTADEAAAMTLLGEAWLRANAPERLKQSAT